MTSAERPRLEGRVLKILPFFLLVFLGLTFFRLGGYGNQSEQTALEDMVALQGATMGTTYMVKVAGPLDAKQQDALRAAIESALTAVDSAMSTYRDDSELSRFNREAIAGQPFTISPALREVADVAMAVGKDSSGALDITVGPLVDAWGFGPDTPTTKPSAATLAALRERTGLSQLQLSPAGLIRAQSGVRCDLSAVAKGYAVDQVAEALTRAGVGSYLVEVGGELKAKGLRPDGQPFRVGIERPDPETRAVERVVPLSDLGMATSGDYRNFFRDGDRRRSHLLDPRTGAPVEHALVSVTVLHRSTAWADAWATALLVLGPDAGPSLAEAQQLAAFFIVHATGQEPRSISTAAFNALISQHEDPR